MLLMIPIWSALAAATHHVGVLSRQVLLTLMELVANTRVLDGGANELLESIIMAIDFERICYDVLYAVVVSDDFNFVDHTKLRLSTARAWNLGKDFVVVPSD